MPTTAKTYKSSTATSATRKTYDVSLKVTTSRNSYGADNAKALGQTLEYWCEDQGFEYTIEVKEVKNGES